MVKRVGKGLNRYARLKEWIHFNRHFSERNRVLYLDLVAQGVPEKLGEQRVPLDSHLFVLIEPKKWEREGTPPVIYGGP